MDKGGRKEVMTSNVMTRGKTWLRDFLAVPSNPSHFEGFEGGSPDFSVSPGHFIKRGSFSTQDFNPGTVLGFENSPRRGSDFKSIEDYSTELANAELNDKKDLKQKLDQMSATLKKYEVIGSQKTISSDAEIFSLDIDLTGLNQQPVEETIQEKLDATQATISRFLPNHWLFVKSGDEDEDIQEEEKPKSRKTSDGPEPSKIKHPITQTAKKMLEKRELNVFVPQST